MRHASLVFLVGLFCLASVKAEENKKPNVVYIHPATLFKVPEAVGPYTFAEGRFYPNEELGSIMGFFPTGEQQTTLTLYISKKPGRNLKEQVDDYVAGMHELKGKGNYAKVDLKAPEKVSDHAYRFSGTIDSKDPENPDQTNRAKTYALFLDYKGYTVKIRISSANDYADHEKDVAAAEKTMLELVKAQLGDSNSSKE